MSDKYPSPDELGVKVPPHVVRASFYAGFQHALAGGQLCKLEHLKLSFREGYRAGKLVIRARRGESGVVDFPLQGRITFKVAS